MKFNAKTMKELELAVLEDDASSQATLAKHLDVHRETIARRRKRKLKRHSNEDWLWDGDDRE